MKHTTFHLGQYLEVSCVLFGPGGGVCTHIACESHKAWEGLFVDNVLSSCAIAGGCNTCLDITTLFFSRKNIDNVNMTEQDKVK